MLKIARSDSAGFRSTTVVSELLRLPVRAPFNAVWLVIGAFIVIYDLSLGLVVPLQSWDALVWYGPKAAEAVATEGAFGAESYLYWQHRHSPIVVYILAGYIQSTLYFLSNTVIQVAAIPLLVWCVMRGYSTSLAMPAAVISLTIPLLENHRVLFGYTEILATTSASVLCMAISRMMDLGTRALPIYLPVVVLAALGLLLSRNTGLVILILVALSVACAFLIRYRHSRLVASASILSLAALHPTPRSLMFGNDFTIRALGYELHMTDSFSLSQLMDSIVVGMISDQSFSIVFFAIVFLTLYYKKYAINHATKMTYRKIAFSWWFMFYGSLMVVAAFLTIDYFKVHTINQTLFPRVILPMVVPLYCMTCIVTGEIVRGFNNAPKISSHPRI